MARPPEEEEEAYTTTSTSPEPRADGSMEEDEFVRHAIATYFREHGDRSHVRLTQLAPGESIPACTRGDAYGALVMAGSFEAAAKSFGVDDVLIAARGVAIPAMTAGPQGAQVLEHFRTARAL